ncbi:DUF4224 domain-containing protein [Pusillimonas sp. ANT_WB101]|uniref:DUF4224 domain-containing protein n=1 Tax=Pusillimonas sp. ANT_WB101 TaxID=2597356 RepID=UPI00165E0AEC|nr:DUF4224 domain-containing protein [Pusillimonas sp. ANT_WB101]
MLQPPYLTDYEIAAICDPLVMPAAQRRHLKSLGLLVKEKPNGRALVARSEFERVLGAARMTSAPEIGGDIAALRQRWASKNGTQTQKR